MNMPEDRIIEPFTAPEIFVDGFTQHEARNGVMTCIGYRAMKDGKFAVVRLVWPVVSTGAAIDDAIAALGAHPDDSGPTDPKRGVH
jgi:hypothetical protein